MKWNEMGKKEQERVTASVDHLFVIFNDMGRSSSFPEHSWYWVNMYSCSFCPIFPSSTPGNCQATAIDWEVKWKIEKKKYKHWINLYGLASA